MQVRVSRAVAVLVVLPVLAACQSKKSANPLSPDVAGPIPGVEITAPKPVEPKANAQVPTDEQPLTLMLENAASNGQRPLTYRLEVASDSSFASLVFTKEGVTPGGDGHTKVTLPDKLASDRIYYWRARAQDGANTGPFSAPVEFKVITPVVIEAPTPTSPIGGEVASTNPPQLRFDNAAHSGPVGAIKYRVEISTDQAFTKTVWAQEGGESPGHTQFTPGSPLTAGAAFYWRARASDPGHVGPWSHTVSFHTPAAAPEPDPGSGGGGGGGGSAGGGGSCASNNGNAIVSCVASKYASYRRAGVSTSTRKSNMQFLRDRIIEAGLCGGLDLGWNLKRGGPEISNDFLAERRGGSVVGHDIAIDYENTGRELQLYWGGGTHPVYTKYTRSYSCN